MNDTEVMAGRRQRLRFPQRLSHWLLIILILCAMARLAWGLGAKNLWWDESLSLQRAESGWPALLLGRLIISDGLNPIPTTDQHPFFFFSLLGILVRLAGRSEFVLRYVSLMASTLLVPTCWTLARYLVRQGVLPRTAPWWAALLAAINPFYLWYGQEARMYTLVPLLALISTYLLLRWAEADTPRHWRYLVAYAVTVLCLLNTHYLAFLMLPVQAGIFLAKILRCDRQRALVLAGGLLVPGVAGVLAAGTIGTRLLLSQPDAGSNFSRISLRIMAQDLLNAFSLGLSVNIAQVRWLDYLFGVLALLGAVWSWQRRLGTPRLRWLLPAFVLVPVLILEVLQSFHPAYMNARHMSLISGAFILSVGGGLAWIWQFRRWAGSILAIVVLAGSGYSTANYFRDPLYTKDEFAAAGAYLRREIQPGDLVVAVPPQMARLYDYYLPRQIVEEGTRAGLGTGWQALPLLTSDWQDTANRFEALIGGYRRIWLVASGMVPLDERQKPAREWLPQHAFQVRDNGFQANTFLYAKLFLPKAPVLSQVPTGIQHPSAATFGSQVRLAGYDVGRPLAPGSVTPITLYWQPTAPISQRYKYILRLVSDDPAQPGQVLYTTEREPYDGTLPTSAWQPGQTIVEYSDVLAPAHPGPAHLTLQIYNAETLEKLPLAGATASGQSAADGETLVLPYDAP